MELQQHFEQVRGLIRSGQSRALQAAYAEQLSVYWQVGAYVYHRLETAEWGAKTVEQLANWLKEKEPTLKGFGRRSLYRMKEFYQTWHELDWDALKRDGSVIVSTALTQLQNTENQSNSILGKVLPRTKELPRILAGLNWSHHIDILGKTRDLEEKVFYLLLSIREKYTVKELQRQLNSGLFERQKLSRQQLVGNKYPKAEIIPQIFRDKYIFEFLDLPEPYSENDLQKGLVKRLREFILEMLCKALHNSSYVYRFIM